jgi:hypothetical protein
MYTGRVDFSGIAPLAARLGIWWGIVSRLSVALLENRSVIFVETRPDGSTLSVAHGNVIDMDSMASEARWHAKQARDAVRAAE